MAISKSKLYEGYFKFYCTEGKLEVQVNRIDSEYLWTVVLNGVNVGTRKDFGVSVFTPTKAKEVAAELLRNYKK